MSDCNPIAIPMEIGAKLSKLEGEKVVDSNIYRSMNRFTTGKFKRKV
jgi:hypothetical protein